VVAGDRRLLLGEHRADYPQVVFEALEALLQRRELRAAIPASIVLPSLRRRGDVDELVEDRFWADPG